MLVSVIVVSYNSGPLLTECIRAALASTVPVEVIVSDNGSIDCSLGAIEQMAVKEPRVSLVCNGANLGFAGANNRVLDQVRGRYILFLNPDCLVAPDTLERVIAGFGTEPAAGMAGCLIVNPDGSEQEGCRRREPTPGRLLASALGFGHWTQRNTSPADFPNNRVSPSSAVQHVDAISGAFMMVKREALQSVGSFDDAYFMHWEDLDLCSRFRRAGYKILFVSLARALHFKGTSSQRKPFSVEWYKHAGMGRFLRKFYFARWPLLFYSMFTFPIWLRFLFKVIRPSRTLTRHPAPCAQLGSDRDEIWVFGATSVVGHCLLPRLMAAGYRVRAFSRTPVAACFGSGVQLVWETANISTTLVTRTSGRPRIVIHLAPLHLLPGQLDYLFQAGMQQLIAFGSTSVFTKNQGTPQECALMQHLRIAEQVVASRCSERDVRWSIFRPTITYCPRMDRSLSLLARFIRVMRFFPIVGDAQGLRQPVHADDLARACMLLLSSAHGWNHTYNLSGGEILSYREMLEKIFRREGRRIRIFRVPDRLFQAALIVMRIHPAYRSLNIEMARRTDINMVFDHSSAREAFGYDPRPFVP